MRIIRTNKLALLAVVAFIAMLSSCTKRYVTEEYVTEEYYVTQGATLIPVKLRAMANKWQINGTEGIQGCYMFQTFEMPEIDESVIDAGAVLAYQVEYLDNGAARLNQMPFLLPYDGDYGTVYENIRYDTEYDEKAKTGYLTIIIESTDYMAYPRTGDMDFKITVVKP